MKQRKIFFPLFSIFFTLFLVVLGILLNNRYPTLSNGGVLSATDAQKGVTLIGWQEEENGEWSFSFSASPDVPRLVLCRVRSGKNFPSAQNNSTEFLSLSPTDSAGRYELRTDTAPSGLLWISSSDRASSLILFRYSIQLITIAAFVSLLFVILALNHYKPQLYLKNFIFYLFILVGWSILAAIPYLQTNPIYLTFLRLCFSSMVLSSVFLSATLVGFSPCHQKKPHLTLDCLLVLLLLLLGCIPNSLFRVIALALGTLNCFVLLLYAYKTGKDGSGILLLSAAITTGLRTWVLLALHSFPLFYESLLFYILRCARCYDLPFALGCTLFVCRRFALQFDKTEILARELDERVAERTRCLTEETEARKSMMLNIFHDLRSPLFSIASGLEILQTNPAALTGLLPILRQRTIFLRNLTEDIFLAAKLEQHQILLNEDRINLAEIVQQVCNGLSAEATEKDIVFSVSCPTALPVWGDDVRLEQVVQNLVTNALHYTPSHGKIGVNCWAEEGQAHLSVSDTGCGIPPEEQEKIFRCYFHTVSSPLHHHESSGLGLTIAKELVELHHGTITLKSAVNEGSTFTIHLPLLEESE